MPGALCLGPSSSLQPVHLLRLLGVQPSVERQDSPFPGAPSQHHCCTVLTFAMVLCSSFPFPFPGYWAYGHLVNDNILFSLEHPRGVIALAAMMVLVHVTGSYQVYSMPVRSLLLILQNPLCSYHTYRSRLSWCWSTRRDRARSSARR